MKGDNFIIMMSKNIVVLCTTPDIDTAQELSTKVIENHLVACVTILPNVVSFYYWEKKMQKKLEVQMILKTNSINQESLLDYLKFHHPYQIPEILVLPVIFGNNDYLSWINDTIKTI